MTRSHPPLKDESTDEEATLLVVPIRRSRWLSFFVGVAAAVLCFVAAALLAGLLLLLPGGVDGAWVVITFGALLFGLFFFSLPRQRRYVRHRDSLRPGARLSGGLLTIPSADDTELLFNLDEPHELTFGWFEVVTRSARGPTTNTRGLMTYAILSQARRGLFLLAEDSVREAQAAGWPHRTSSTTPDLRVRLWARDLVTLVEAVRSRTPPARKEPQKIMPPPDTELREELIREWPENPLPARNRHEVTLFLEWMKVELISRAPAEGGEVCVGRVRGADPSAAPDTYRLVFALLEADPEDENDFGSGISKIFDPAELMLLLSRMERDGVLGGGVDTLHDAALALTHRSTREVEALGRAKERALAVIEQLTRFARPEGYPALEAVKGSAQRTWFVGARERFDASALETKRRVLSETLEHLQPPPDDSAEARKQTALVHELRARCPEYLAELRSAGFEGGQVLHPLFSHAYHLTRFAARALRDGETAKARAALAAWANAEPSEVLFPVNEFADAVYELKLEPRTAASFVPPSIRNTFFSHYETRVDPDYNPYSY